MANTSGNAGSFRQETFTRPSLRAAARHEERKDVTGRGDPARGISGRVVRPVPPLVWRAGLIEVPEGWSADGDWDCGLEADYEAHVAGVRRHGKVGDDLGLHALLQFPALLPVENEADERRMLQAAVSFVDRTHGGRAVFHARLDRDEDGRRTVDVFFVPTYEKALRKGAKASAVSGERWASLSKHQKDLAAAQGLPVDKIGRGRALQTAWYEHLRDEMGLEWAERGASKNKGRDRVEPEIYKLRREREAAEAAQAAAEQALADLKARQVELSRREENVLRGEMTVRTLISQQRYAEERIKADRQALQRREDAAAVEAFKMADIRTEWERKAAASEAQHAERLRQHRVHLEKTWRQQDERERALEEREKRVASLEDRDRAVQAGMQAFLNGDIVKVTVNPEGEAQLWPRNGFNPEVLKKLISEWRAEVVKWLQFLQTLFAGVEPAKRREQAPTVIARRQRRGMEMD
ncbi:hypothetical protein FHR90_000696 [Endobacter medicaginis]|uniref:Uncharacterized protein n=1 Tax=Endobacter medicaginis TaxID=1181271 RepID=A0A839UZR6_9PROT|nr:hypothetical protein [Endobacter medicaginis]MBB3172882.1 hypothetical protein [Endobacter medicaginis]MCX5474807.1 hypothetical protein [Endobacter medicaginis]NVN29393.1 hypothetical protein [Endobacter medicaginis]